jgi:hypothetical protein
MPFEARPFILAITIVSFGALVALGNPLSPGWGWPEKVKGLARYVLRHSPNRANCSALETGSINSSGTNDPILIINL